MRVAPHDASVTWPNSSAPSRSGNLESASDPLIYGVPDYSSHLSKDLPEPDSEAQGKVEPSFSSIRVTAEMLWPTWAFFFFIFPDSSVPWPVSSQGKQSVIFGIITMKRNMRVWGRKEVANWTHRLFTHSALIMLIAAVIHTVSTRGWTLHR